MNPKNLLAVVAISLVLMLLASESLQSREEIKIEEETTVKAEESKAEKDMIPEERILGEMVLLSGGTFWMGLSENEAEKAFHLGRENKIGNAGKVIESEMPRHKVKLRPFYIDKYEVTNKQFAAFVSATGYKPQGEWAEYSTPGREHHPAVAVTWHDAKTYAEWVGKRLPTEAEWEFAARGGLEEQLFPWGDEISKKLANFAEQRIHPYAPVQTMGVGSHPANSFGLYDMSGNVGEWCADWYDENYYSNNLEENPVGPAQGNKMVVRGGAWGTSPFYLRVTSRGSFEPNRYDYRIGFRCVRSLD